ncbi:MAG: HAMP domain-containing histidine kinase, partial [Candidatus Sacchiramonaceae bacterium]|nr:HAMP domain-containing histidine kinase [Candidatus Saccharimonadaceae bacterium]
VMLCLVTDLHITDLNFWMAIIVHALVSGLVLWIGQAIILKPQRDIFDVMSQISSGSSNIRKAPNLSSKHNTKTGLSDVLKFIYSLDIAPESEDDVAEQSANPLNTVLERSQVGVLALDQKNHIVYKNKNVPNIEDLIFTNQKPITSWIEKARESKISDDISWRRIPDDVAENDERKIYDIYAHYKKDAPADLVMFFIDKTDSYMPDEDDLNFIAFAAHELRGPITIIRGYLDVLSLELEDKLSTQQAELFKRLIVSSNKLSGYVNNILNVSRFDRNRLAFDLSEHTIDDVINSVKEDAELRASSQSRMLEINIDSKDLPTIGADLSSISEVLTNLIDNAIKYSNEGGLVKITAEKSGNFVDISVQDFGIGIPNSVMNNLFQKFYRSHRSRETVAGTGIGLYISRAIIEGHSGQMSVKSIEGEGSTFTVSLPIFATISDKLLDSNSEVIKQPGGGWIKNHGKIRR